MNSSAGDLNTRVLVKIYRSPRREGMYLYVNASDGLDRVPEALLQRFGKPEDAMTLLLSPQRQLAWADSVAVLRTLEETGYYLQLPPTSEPDEMTRLASLNTKLSR